MLSSVNSTSQKIVVLSGHPEFRVDKICQTPFKLMNISWRQSSPISKSLSKNNQIIFMEIHISKNEQINEVRQHLICCPLPPGHFHVVSETSSSRGRPKMKRREYFEGSSFEYRSYYLRIFLYKPNLILGYS